MRRIKKGEISGPCPRCHKSSLEMVNVRYSAPLQFDVICKNCNLFSEGEDEPLNILEGEAAVRKRPELYVESENPEWRELAKHLLETPQH